MGLIRPEIRESSGRIQLAKLMHLAYQLNIGGSVWPQQFLFGCKIIGGLIQGEAFPFSDRESDKLPLPPRKLLFVAQKRFSQRARISVAKNAKELWAESTEQVQKGWLAKPAPPCPHGANHSRPEIVDGT